MMRLASGLLFVGGLGLMVVAAAEELSWLIRLWVSIASAVVLGGCVMLYYTKD